MRADNPAPYRGEREFRRLLEKLPAAAYTCDASGLITFFNRRAVEVWGREPKLNHPDDRFCGSFRLFAADGAAISHDRCWMALALRDNREYDGCEIVIERPDGGRATVLAHANPMRDEEGTVCGAVNVLVDITERRRAEEEIRRANQTLRTLVESSPLPIVVIDPDPPVVRLWNPAAERLFGWSAAEVVGRELPIVSDEKRDEFRTRREAVAAGQPVLGAETYRNKKSGASIAVSLSAAPLHDAAGKVSGILLLFADVTELKRAVEALKDADRRKDEFLAMLAHELRNPLAPLRNALQVLRLAGRGGAAGEQACAMMERQLQHMVRLIDDLLDVSRITRGKLRLRTERVELSAVLASAVDTARPAVAAAAHRLAVNLPPRPLYLEADPVRLAQVFANLLNNAAKYTERGGRIELTAGSEGGDAVVRVRDDGIGIPAAELPHIFDMFAQVDHSLERSHGGLGIGLTLVKRLVEMHGGSVEAKSGGPGKGSEFTVRLPAACVAQPEAPSAAAKGHARAAPRRVLVADDNNDAAASLAELLRLQGHEVRVVHDGRAAVEEVAVFRPDLILLDIGMPGLNGYEAARSIRHRPGGKDVTLVALTGWGQEDAKRRALESGFDHHFTKPMSLADLDHLLAGRPAGRAADRPGDPAADVPRPARAWHSA